MRFRVVGLVFLAVILNTVVFTISDFRAEPALANSPEGRLRVAVVAPVGVPVTLTVGRDRKVIATDGSVGRTARTFRVPLGRNRVRASPVVHDGRLYVATGTRVRKVRAGKVARLAIRYIEPEGVARNLALQDLGSDTVSLAWEGVAGGDVMVRRTSGSSPASKSSDGTPIPVQGTRATDSSVVAGQQYTYAVFSRWSGRWIGPLTTSLSVPDPDGESVSFLTSRDTRLLEDQDVLRVEDDASGPIVYLRAPVTVGSVVVIPQGAAALPGGYIGGVSSIASDGGAQLTPATPGDALDYFEADLAGFEGAPTTPERAPFDGGSGPAPRSADSRAPSAASTSSAAINPVDCGLATGLDLEFAPTIQLHGAFQGRMLWKQLPWLPNAPRGAHISGNLGVRVTGAASVRAEVSVSCGLRFKKVVTPVPAGPIPMAFVFFPEIGVTTTGAVEIANVGARADAGMWFDAKFGAGMATEANGGARMHAEPLTPQAKSTGSVSLAVRGALTFGPALTSDPVGVTAGVRGTLTAVDASITSLSVSDQGDPTSEECSVTDVSWELDTDVVAKGWLPAYETEVALDIAGLDARGSYLSDGPIYNPTNCDRPAGNDVFVLDLGQADQEEGPQYIATTLDTLGYDVEIGSELPSKLSDYGQIWANATYDGYPANVLDALVEYVEDGGSVFLNSEHDCCETTNVDVTEFLGRVVRSSPKPVAVTQCTVPCVEDESPLPLNPEVRGGLANRPNAGAGVYTSALGIYENVPPVNQLLTVDGQVGGTVWAEDDLLFGMGRVVTIGDSNWANGGRFPGGKNQPFLENVAQFLSRADG